MKHALPVACFERRNSPLHSSLPLPWGEGWGEGVRTIREAEPLHIDSAHPLTLSLSPWERGPDAPCLHTSEALIEGEMVGGRGLRGSSQKRRQREEAA
jgi:hypothetical protein